MPLPAIAVASKRDVLRWKDFVGFTFVQGNHHGLNRLADNVDLCRVARRKVVQPPSEPPMYGATLRAVSTDTL